jgi:hypothetical protein
VQTSDRLLVQEYLDDSENALQTLRIYQAMIDKSSAALDVDVDLDLATFELPAADITSMGKPIVPASWPPRVPHKGVTC